MKILPVKIFSFFGYHSMHQQVMMNGLETLSLWYIPLIFFPTSSMVKIFHVLNFHPSRLQSIFLTELFLNTAVALCSSCTSH